MPSFADRNPTLCEGCGPLVSRTITPGYRVLVVLCGGGMKAAREGDCTGAKQVEWLVAMPGYGSDMWTPPIDVLVVQLTGDDLRGLTWALREHERLGSPEIVCLTPGDDCPIARGLAEMGLEPVISNAQADSWLPQKVPVLAQMARARRAFAGAQAELGLRRKPLGRILRDPKLGLFAAEQQFREAYVRGLLELTSSRKEAAARANVSYRTLCHIVEKLKLTSVDL